MTHALPADDRSPLPLAATWRLHACAPDAWLKPSDIPRDAEGLAARVPGTVAGALRDAGRLDAMAPEELDDRDWWFTTEVEGFGRHELHLDGVATISEVFLDDEMISRGSSMFEARSAMVDLRGVHRLAIRCVALAPILARPGKRARWRPRIATPQTLRLHRATLLGRMGGWCPPVHAVGPYRDVTITPASPGVVRSDVHASLAGGEGRVAVTLWTDSLSEETARVRLGARETAIPRIAENCYGGVVAIDDPRRWWPHTHGEPALHALAARIGAHEVDLGHVGFRDIEIDRDVDGEGFALRVNGERVFCRGALWTTPDLVSLPGARADYEPLLRLARDAGMNMIRVGGTMLYELRAFHDLCDELGLLVWQDFMFSNFDYPAGDADFARAARVEAEQFLARSRSSPSLAIVCGASEVAQQAAMLGLPAAAWTNDLFETVLREPVERLRPDVPYIAHTPFGGAMPFEPRRGVCHYYGVSAYMRPIADARRAGVRFAGECLGFANVPESDPPLEPVRAAIVQPCWSERHEGDVGATWFFEDVRNHYIRDLYNLDPEALRAEDPDRYLEVSRATNAELMEGVFSLWRRAGSPTAGGLVWFLRDVVNGAGFGIIDASGRPKSVYHALRRAFAPLRVLLDEGLNGLDVHLVNDRPETIEATLSLMCLRDGATPVMRAERSVTIAPRSASAIPATDLWGAFFDTGYAYRFGPPSHDVVIARLRDTRGDILSEAFHFPLGRGHARNELGLAARLERDGEQWTLAVSCQRFAQSVHIRDDAFESADNWFHLAPGVERRIALAPRGRSSAAPAGTLRAINGLDVARYGAAP